MIYLDNAATSEKNDFWFVGNPSSNHRVGKDAKSVIESCKSDIIEKLNAPKEGTIIFTSGGTESNNLAILGSKDYLKRFGMKRIITSPIEHPSVLECCNVMKQEGFIINYAKVDAKGRIDLPVIERLIQQMGVGLVTIQMVNSEIGTIQPIREIGEMCKQYGVLFHVDAVQGFGHYPIDVLEDKIDMVSISGHKIGGVKGVGALYVGDKTKLSPIIYGGGQQYGLRSGTENVGGIISLSAQTYLCNVDYAMEHFKDLYIAFEEGFTSAIGDIQYWFNGYGYGSHILSITIPHVESSALMMMLDSKGVYVSTGSACHSNSLEPSNVLKEIGLSDEEALCTIRVSFSDSTTLAEAKEAARIIGETASDLYFEEGD